MSNRHNPAEKYNHQPCIYTAVGSAYEDINKRPYNENLPKGLRPDGYSSLQNANKYIRANLVVQKYQYFKRNERPLLKDFIMLNYEKCVVCVYGHYIYVDGTEYWSYFDNMFDPVVAVWYLQPI